MRNIFRRFVEDVLLVKRGEEKKVLFFLLFFAVLIMGQEMGAGAAVAFFLTSAGINNLPLMLLLAAVINTFAVLSYMAISARLGNKVLFITILLTGFAAVVPGRILCDYYPFVFSFVMYAVAEFMLAAINLHFSAFLADYFNTRQSKRLFPLVYSGSRIGGIAGGLLLSLLTVKIGSLNIFVIWAVALITGILMLSLVDRFFRPDVFVYEERQKESTQFFRHIQGAFDLLKKSVLLKSIAAGVFLLGFLSLFSKYLYSGVFVTTFPDVDKLTAFYGVFIIISNILGLFIQVVISNRLIDSFGLGVANLAYALSFSSSFAALVFGYGFPSAMWAKFNDEQLESAIQDPVESLLYNAVPDNERARARAVSSGLIKPLSEICASIFLAVAKIVMTPLYIAVTALAISFLYIFTATKQNRGYVNGLMQMVKNKTFNLEDLENLRWEKASSQDLETLYNMVSDGDKSVRDSAITLLLHLDEDIDFLRLGETFFDWIPEIQLEYLRNYFKRAENIDRSLIMKCLKICPVNVKILIIEYFIETGNRNLSDEIGAYLRDKEDLEIQNSALRYFYLMGDEGRKKVSDIFEKRLESGDESIVRANLAIIRELYEENLLYYVKKMINHSNREISVDAVNTLAVIYQPRGKEEPEIMDLVNSLIERGGYHELKAAVVILGKKVSPQARDMLINLLDTGFMPLRDMIVDILNRNYPRDEDLYFSMIESSFTPLVVKENLIYLLKKMEKPPEPHRLKDILKGLIKNYFEMILELNWLESSGFGNSLMADMCSRQLSHFRIMILQILELLLHEKVILSIEKALLTKNPRLISNALELFENVWDKKQAKELVILLYPESFEEELKISRKFTSEKVEIKSILDKYLNPNRPRWDICTSLLLLKGRDLSALNVDFDVFNTHKDPMVREIAGMVSDKRLSRDREVGMFTSVDKMMCLKNAPLFKSLKMDELKMVADICKEKISDSGDLIIEMGEVGNTMFIISEGEVEIFLPGKEKKSLAVIGNSEFFGEMALFEEDVRSASVCALKPTKLLYLEREHFLNLIYEKPDISIEIIKVLSSRIRNMDSTIIRSY